MDQRGVQRKGANYAMFAGIWFFISGGFNVISGLAALAKEYFANGEYLYNNPQAWAGLIAVGVGLLVGWLIPAAVAPAGRRHRHGSIGSVWPSLGILRSGDGESGRLRPIIYGLTVHARPSEARVRVAARCERAAGSAGRPACSHLPARRPALPPGSPRAGRRGRWRAAPRRRSLPDLDDQALARRPSNSQ
jgi:hypothetical protein